MNAYFRSRDGVVDGPYFEGQLLGMYDSGELAAADLLCMQGSEDWLPSEAVMAGVLQNAADLQPVRSAPRPPPVAKTPPRKGAGVVRVLMAVFLVGGAGLALASLLSSDLPPETEYYYQAQRLIKQSLVAPASAKFLLEAGASREAWHKGGDVWWASGIVDSQNRMGAMLRAEWDVAWNVETGQVLYLRVGKKTVGDVQAALAAAKR